MELSAQISWAFSFQNIALLIQSKDWLHSTETIKVVEGVGWQSSLAGLRHRKCVGGRCRQNCKLRVWIEAKSGREAV